MVDVGVCGKPAAGNAFAAQLVVRHPGERLHDSEEKPTATFKSLAVLFALG